MILYMSKLGDVTRVPSAQFAVQFLSYLSSLVYTYTNSPVDDEEDVTEGDPDVMEDGEVVSNASDDNDSDVDDVGEDDSDEDSED